MLVLFFKAGEGVQETGRTGDSAFAAWEREAAEASDCRCSIGTATAGGAEDEERAADAETTDAVVAQE